MNELAKRKFELLLKDLKEMQELEKESGKQYFTLQLFAVRVKEIYDLLIGDKLMEDNRFYEMYEMQRDRANKLEDKLNQIKEILNEDVYLGTMGNRIKYEILEVIEPKEDSKQLKLKGWK